MKLNALLIIRNLIYFVISFILLFVAAYGCALAICGDYLGSVIALIFFPLFCCVQAVKDRPLK